MLVIKQPDAAVVTTTEAKRDLPGAFRVAERRRVYVTKDGKPIGGLVSMAMMGLLEQALSERAERVARRRSVSVRVFRRGSEPASDNAHMTAEQGIDLMRRLSRSAQAFVEAKPNARA